MTGGSEWREALAARVDDLARGRVTPVAPRDAATVLLVRDGDSGLEVFLVRRARGMAFAAGMYAFPGGSVEPEDDQWRGTLPASWVHSLAGGDEALARRLIGAAVRETYEECGVWLGVDPPPADGAIAGVRLRVQLLRPWAHWITPEAERRRFDTRFLLAALPAGAHAEVRGGEADEGRWIAPRDGAALAMLPPTRTCLTELAEVADVATALAASRTVRTVRPVLRRGADGQIELSLPDGLAEPSG